VSSVVYTMAAIDELIPDEVFRFTPPAGAKQVDQLEP
jgi:outer membrane lipoprotein-sorting protein